jgi:hypothetical protein
MSIGQGLRFRSDSFHFRDLEGVSNGSHNGFEKEVLTLVKILFFFQVDVIQHPVEELILQEDHESRLILRSRIGSEFEDEEQSYPAQKMSG